MIGTTISHYHIVEEIGGGGMGVLYRAEDTRLKRQVALKFLPPQLTHDTSAKARFIHEARAASALQHHNICTIHDIDETDDGQLFISMDVYEGESLGEVAQRGPPPDGRSGRPGPPGRPGASAARTRRRSSTGTSSRTTSL